MGTLLDGLLAFSRLGRAELRQTRVSLYDLVKAALSDLRQEMEGRKIEWIIEALPETQGDPGLLREALIHLVSNAVKYTRTGRHARIEIGATASDQETIVFIRDNGVGFDMQDGSKLFGVFQRLHSSSEFEGIGMGLAIVRRIIQRHGGRTWAEGSVDGGATFYFSLPKSELARHEA